MAILSLYINHKYPLIIKIRLLTDWRLSPGILNGRSKLVAICRLKRINHTDSARHTTTGIFGSVLCETKWLLLFLTVNTETKPQNKTVERITIDPHVSHAQSHLNGQLFPPEEPVQTFKSTDNARFSPLTLSFFPSLKPTYCNLMWHQLKPGGWGGANLAWLRVPTHSIAFGCCYSHLAPSNIPFVGHRPAGPSVSAPPPGPRTTTPHTTVEDDISSPPTPPLSIANPISKVWVFLIYWWPHIPAAVPDCSLARLGAPQLLWSCISIWMEPIRGWIRA